ncbi:MAG: preprotein translocase subunit SecY [Spirochaetaceae bacterium]|nr:preprotein translocase subunit SecY [Spirochaetaceae bacterium]MBR3812923.1 preprotein translocase subunit SecY [Spirochaetaceae bacterium]MDD6487981.1 preprotein translocase subunit SecY [Spirochaetales bacterium]
MANNPIVNMLKVKELRERIFFTFVMLAVFRLGSVLTIPGISAQALTAYFKSLTHGNAFVDYMDFFAGGAFSNFSVFMLGVMPYISTQIIMQLALIIFPSLKKIVQDDGGQKKFNAWTRIGTVFVCLIQSGIVVAYASSIPGAIILNNRIVFTAIVLITVTTGAMITVWMGDQITARGIGNGISMLIFAGIVARWPSAIWELGRMVGNGDVNIVPVIVVFLMFIAIIGLVILEQQGERKIPIHYAKRVVGRKMYGGQSTYIPFKINPSGVIPVIFASTFLTFPLQIVNGLAASNRFLNKVAAILNPAGWWYNIILVLLIVFFAYFYTQVTLNPTEIAKQIRENGGSIPGIRTDKTEDYMQKVLNRLILPGSLYLAFIAVIPTLIQNWFGFPQSISMLMGGTSLLIVVGVDLDTMSQVEAMLKMHHHDGLVKKGKLRSRNL